MTGDTAPQPYVNDMQEWLGESKTAGKCLAGWHLGSLLAVEVGLFFYGLPVAAVGVVSLFVSALVHYWRVELAPEMRHSQGETDD